MAKKVEAVEISETETVAETPKVRLSGDFGRADLNDMRDAINELFAR